MIRILVVAALSAPLSAFAGTWLSSTPREAHSLEQARGICNYKTNLLVQAAGDRDRGVPESHERQRLFAIARNVDDISPDDVAGIVEDGYSMTTLQISQAAASMTDACMLPFRNGFQTSQTPYFLNPDN